MVDQDLSETVNRVLDGVLAGGPVAPGARGQIYRVVDELRARPGQGDRAILAERISLQLHRLESTLHLRDQAVSNLARAQLKELAGHWIQGRVCAPSGSQPERLARVHPLDCPNAGRSS